MQSASAMIGRQDWDPAIDPPPDLAVEVDITSGSVPRQPIYAALGVPELWRYDGQRMIPMRLNPSGTYVPIEKSLAFPDLSFEKLSELIGVGLTQGQYAAVRALRAWLRDAPS